MQRPSAEQLSQLQGFERTAFAIADTINRRPALKTAAHGFLKTFGAGWVHYCTRHIRYAYGLDELRALNPDRGVLVVSNHRSFFDMYVISCVMLRETEWIKGMYFPVRSDFFYEGPDGVFVNAIMAAMTMYPPVLRDSSRRTFNSYVTDFISDQMKVPGMLCGFHPEGTRNKTDDPYKLLAASPGVGQIVHAARPIVIPAFINGLGNNLPKQVMGNFTRKGDPITIAFGKPLDLESFYAQPAKLRTYKYLADHLRDEVQKVGEHERVMRARDGLPPLGPKRDEPGVAVAVASSDAESSARSRRSERDDSTAE